MALVVASTNAPAALNRAGGYYNAGNYVYSRTVLAQTLGYLASNPRLTITAATLNVTANDFTKSYNGLAFTGGNGVVYSGFLPGDSVANSLTVSAQMALPDWVRARGMSIYQMAVMGAAASGAAIWGQIATLTNVREALIIAALTSVASSLLVHWFKPLPPHEVDLTPARVINVPDLPERPGRGRGAGAIEKEGGDHDAEASTGNARAAGRRSPKRCASLRSSTCCKMRRTSTSRCLQFRRCDSKVIYDKIIALLNSCASRSESSSCVLIINSSRT